MHLMHNLCMGCIRWTGQTDYNEWLERQVAAERLSASSGAATRTAEDPTMGPSKCLTMKELERMVEPIMVCRMS